MRPVLGAVPLLAFCLCACGDDLLASIELGAATDHLPCTGMRRLRVTVFYDEQHGQGRDSFGKFYSDSGECALPAGLPLEIERLPITDRMWIMAEGFDSTARGRLCLAQSGVFSRSDVEGGHLVGLTLQREPVEGLYPTASLVIEQLAGLAELEPVDSLTFSINYGMVGSFGGSFYLEAGKRFSDMTLVVSSLQPGRGKRILIEARRGPERLATWRQESFDVPEGALFVTLQPEKI